MRRRRTSFTWVAAPLMLALAAGCFGRAANGPPAELRRYSVIMQDRVVGQMTTSVFSRSETETYFTYRDRERGPRLRLHVLTVDHGMPGLITVTGTDDDGNPLREKFIRAKPEVSWTSPVDDGESPDLSAFYLPVSPVPEVLAHLARALLADKDHTLPLLPRGAARLEPWGELTVDGTDEQNNPRRVKLRAYAIHGVQLGPSLLWLEEDGTFFASGSPYLATVRRGFESTLAELFRVQSEALARRELELARQLTDRPAVPVAITGAALFDPKSGTVRPGTTVVVRGAWILSVGPDGKVEVPKDARRIDAAGRTLLPGLWDMHVHPEDMGGVLHLAAGVTSVRDCGSDVGEALGRRAQLARGDALGPRLFLAGLIDGPSGGSAPTKVLVQTPDQAVAAVDRLAKLGFDQVKVYNSVRPELVPIIAERAHHHGLSLSGHVPRGMTAAEAVRAGLDELHHAYFLYPSLLAPQLTDHPNPLEVLSREAAWMDLSQEPARGFIALLRERRTTVDPTLALCESLYTARPGHPTEGVSPALSRLPSPVARKLALGGTPADSDLDRRLRRYFSAILRLVGELDRSGVRLVAGTDWGLAGFTLQRELELMVEAGLPPSRVLRIATLGAAEVMHRDREMGSVEPGKRADLILVDGDPTTRISDIRRVSLVMKDGALFDPGALRSAAGIAP